MPFKFLVNATTVTHIMRNTDDNAINYQPLTTRRFRDKEIDCGEFYDDFVGMGLLHAVKGGAHNDGVEIFALSL